MSNDNNTPDFNDADDAASAAAAGGPVREDSVNNLGDPDADGDFQERADKDGEKN